MPKLEKPLSTLSGDSVQTRYQKALKQITKLLSCNIVLKEEAKQSLLEKERLSVENENLKFSLEQINKQKDDLDKYVTDLTRKYQELEQDCVKLEKPIKAFNEKSGKKSTIDQRLFKDLDSKNVASQSGIQLRRKIQEYMRVNLEQEKYIKQLEKVKQNKSSIINGLTTQCEELNKKVENLSKYLEEFEKCEELKSGNKISGGSQFFRMSKDELVEKIQISERYIQNTHNQCAQLQAKVVQLQRDKILKSKSEKVLGRGSSPVLSICSSNVRLHSQYDDYFNRSQKEIQFTEILKKGKKVQIENKVISKKYEEMKLKFDKIREQRTVNAKELQVMKKKCCGYEKIIEKLQSQIERLMQAYEHDLRSMARNFKQRLEEQRNKFGPTEMSKHLKELDKLHTENKTIKKRNQLFRTQISKNGKAMEMYKAKISELEQKLSQIKEQNNQLKVRNIGPQNLDHFDYDHSGYINGFESGEENQFFCQKRKGFLG